MRIEEFLMNQALLGAGNHRPNPREKMAAEILNGFRTAASVDAVVHMAHYTPQDYHNAEFGSMTFMSDLHRLGVFAIPTMSWLGPLAYRLSGKKVLDLMSGRGMISAVLQSLGVDITPVDNGSWGLDEIVETQRMSCIEAIKEFKPDVVVCAWPDDNVRDQSETFEDVCRYIFDNALPIEILYIGEPAGGCNASDSFPYHMEWDEELMDGYVTLSYLHDAPAWIRKG